MISGFLTEDDAVSSSVEMVVIAFCKIISYLSEAFESLFLTTSITRLLEFSISSTLSFGTHFLV